MFKSIDLETDHKTGSYEQKTVGFLRIFWGEQPSARR